MFTSSPTLAYLIITAVITAGTITEIGCEETTAKIGLELPRRAGFLFGFTVSASISHMKARLLSAARGRLRRGGAASTPHMNERLVSQRFLTRNAPPPPC